jgi:hypothetical protein
MIANGLLEVLRQCRRKVLGEWQDYVDCNYAERLGSLNSNIGSTEFQRNKKTPASAGVFHQSHISLRQGCCELLAQQGSPAFNHVTAPLGFPLFQSLVVATFGFDDFAVVRVLVLLDFTSALGAGSFYRSATRAFGFRFRIQQRDDVAQGFLSIRPSGRAVCLRTPARLAVCRLVDRFLQAGLQLFDSFFGGAVFVDQGHGGYLMCR